MKEQKLKYSVPEKSLAKTFEILTNEGSYRILSAPYLSYQILMRLNVVCKIAILSKLSFLEANIKSFLKQTKENKD